MLYCFHGNTTRSYALRAFERQVPCFKPIPIDMAVKDDFLIKNVFVEVTIIGVSCIFYFHTGITDYV